MKNSILLLYTHLVKILTQFSVMMETQLQTMDAQIVLLIQTGPVMELPVNVTTVEMVSFRVLLARLVMMEIEILGMDVQPTVLSSLIGLCSFYFC
jgi:hypothetical protein